MIQHRADKPWQYSQVDDIVGAKKKLTDLYNEEIRVINMFNELSDREPIQFPVIEPISDKAEVQEVVLKGLRAGVDELKTLVTVAEEELSMMIK